MTFPTTQIPTTNLDADTASPAAARVDLLQAVEHINDIVSSANTAGGVVLLNGSEQIPAEYVPGTIAPPTGVLTLAPVSGRVKIEDVLRLQAFPTSAILNLSDLAEGDVVFSLDGDAGNPCLAVYNGTEWRRVVLGAEISTS